MPHIKAVQEKTLAPVRASFKTVKRHKSESDVSYIESMLFAINDWAEMGDNVIGVDDNLFNVLAAIARMFAEEEDDE